MRAFITTENSKYTIDNVISITYHDAQLGLVYLKNGQMATTHFDPESLSDGTVVIAD